MIFVYLQSCYLLFYGRFIGFMVSVPESGSRGLGSRPGRVIVLCSWAKHFTPTMPLSSNWQEAWRNTWGGGGGNLAMNWHPIQGGRVVILLVTSCQWNRDKLQLLGGKKREEVTCVTFSYWCFSLFSADARELVGAKSQKYGAFWEG